MKKIWRVFRATWMIVTPLLLAASLAFNLLIMAGGLAFDMASSAFEAVTGNQSVATRQANATKKLNKEVAYQKKLNRELNTKVASLSDDLATQKLAFKSASADKMVIHKGKRTTAKAAVFATTATISKRAAATASRSAGSVFGEAIPYVGTAVIVGVTAYELYDLCETVKDMNELSRAFDPSLEPDPNQATVCAMEVPSSQDIWLAFRESPGKAFHSAKDTLQDMGNMDVEMPQINWAENWLWFKSGASSIVASTSSEASSAWSATTGAGKQAYDAFISLFDWGEKECDDEHQLMNDGCFAN